ncbi:MAG: Cna B-type domain-containing protein, partial [Oscillospiraceae bacterium]|nr:Cna B-type domain-containing protein [Oscillospiraceae bacterium]
MRRKISVLVGLLVLLALSSGAVYALPSTASTLTVLMEYGNTPLAGLQIAVCQVATAKEVNGNVVFEKAASFAGVAADFTKLTKEKNITLAASLNAYALANSIPRNIQVTGSDGKAVYSGLGAGLYLAAQVESPDNEYTIDPYLVMVPAANETGGGWNQNVTAKPKTEPVKREGDTVDVSVNKLWEGTGPHPGSVSAQLYRNGSPYGNAVTLNAGNLWTHTWDGLDAQDSWTVDELNPPEGYAKTVNNDVQYSFVITNKKGEEPTATTTETQPSESGTTGSGTQPGESTTTGSQPAQPSGVTTTGTQPQTPVRLLLSKHLYDAENTRPLSGYDKVFSIWVYNAANTVIERVTVKADGNAVVVNGLQPGQTYYVAEAGEESGLFEILRYELNTSTDDHEITELKAIAFSIPAIPAGQTIEISIRVDNRSDNIDILPPDIPLINPPVFDPNDIPVIDITPPDIPFAPPTGPTDPVNPYTNPIEPGPKTGNLWIPFIGNVPVVVLFAAVLVLAAAVVGLVIMR